MSQGRLMRWFSLASLVTVAALMAVPPGASAATIGQTFTPGNPCTPDVIRLQTLSPGGQYEAPFAGVITSWSFQAPASVTDVPQLKFKVARRTSSPNDFTIVGESQLVTPVAGNLNTYATQISVQAGDLIGFYLNAAAGNKGCATVGVPGYGTHAKIGDVAPGPPATFVLGTPAQLDVSANLEPPGTTTASATTPCKGKASTVTGTAGADSLVGSAAADVISGLGGNDTVTALGGNDVVCGGAGKDTLKGGKGKDTLLGQAGKDKLKGGGGKDVCKGGKGKDTASKCEVEKSI
jgi:hypothetical protein